MIRLPNAASKRGLVASGCLAILLTAASAAQNAKSDAGRCKADPKSSACSAKSAPAAADAPAAPVTGDAPAKPLNQAFPFPTEDSKHSGEPQSNGLPAMPTTAVPDPPAESERPMKLPPDGIGSSSSSSSSSDSSGSSSATAEDDDADVAPTTAAANAPVKATKLKDLGSRGDTSAARAKLEETRIADDLKVGRFYMQDGNTQGAYLRFKDAVDHAPDDPAARFALAEAAAKLNKRDEAVVNYRQYLQLDPDGDHDKASRKALQKLGPTSR